MIEKNPDASDVYIYVKYTSSVVSDNQFISIVNNDQLAELIDFERYYDSVPNLQAKDIIQTTIHFEELNIKAFVQNVEYAILNHFEFKSRLQC